MHHSKVSKTYEILFTADRQISRLTHRQTDNVKAICFSNLTLVQLQSWKGHKNQQAA